MDAQELRALLEQPVEMQPLVQMTMEQIHATSAFIYSNLGTRMNEWMMAKYDLAIATQALDRRIGVAMLNGSILGKNEKEREAMAYELFEDEYHQIDALRERVFLQELLYNRAKSLESHLVTSMKIFALTLSDPA